MNKIPFSYLIAAIAIAAAAVLLIPSASGEAQEEGSNEKHLIVVERLDGDHIIYENVPWTITPKTDMGSLSRADLEPGLWLLATIDESQVGREKTLLSLQRAPDDEVVLSGTIGSILRDGEEAVGFTINNLTILLPEEEHAGEEQGGHGEMEVGLGVTVKAKPIKGATTLRALEQPHVIRHHSLLHAITMLMLQIAVILLVAKIGGEIFERFLGQPGVLGELIGGIIISPYALGGLINIPGVGHLFLDGKPVDDPQSLATAARFRGQPRAVGDRAIGRHRAALHGRPGDRPAPVPALRRAGDGDSPRRRHHSLLPRRGGDLVVHPGYLIDVGPDGAVHGSGDGCHLGGYHG